MSLPRVVLKPRRARPFFGRHPWVFAGAIDKVEGTPADGAAVDLVTHTNQFVARGLYNGQSNIRVRLFSWAEQQALDEAFFRARLAAAIDLRRNALGLSGPERACRLVFSEADGLSGLTVDQFDRLLVLQFTSLALAQRRDMLADILQEILQPDGMYLRTERGINKLEGLEVQDGPMRGSVPDGPIVIDECGVRFQVDLREGQKTGFYIDQRENRLAVARYAPGRSMLDAFCYSGGFGLHAARADATSVFGIDSSEGALKLAQANAKLNCLGNIAFERADVFEKLDELAESGQRFGIVVLDPPKFARSEAALEDALRGYRKLQIRALRLLEQGGILVMCCCSGLVTRDMLQEILADVAADTGRPIQILESRGAAADHPVSVSCPETEYLKCLICHVT